MAASINKEPSERFRDAIIRASRMPSGQLPSIEHLRRLAHKLLDSGIGIENQDPKTKKTSLAHAAEGGNSQVFRWLMDEGHDEREISSDNQHNTVMHIAAANGHDNILEIYYPYFPDVIDWPNSRGITPLHVAAQKGRANCVQLLLDLGADMDLPDAEGNTPLHYASMWGYLPIMKILVERGCHCSAKNNDGFTASDFAYSKEVDEALQEMVRMQFQTEKQRRKKQRARDKSLAHRDRGGTGGQTREHRAAVALVEDSVVHAAANGSVDYQAIEDDATSIYTVGTSIGTEGRARGYSSATSKSGNSGGTDDTPIRTTPTPPRPPSSSNTHLPSTNTSAFSSGLSIPNTSVAASATLSRPALQHLKPLPLNAPTPNSNPVMLSSSPIPSPALSPASASSVRKTITRDQQAMESFKATTQARNLSPSVARSGLSLRSNSFGTPQAKPTPFANGNSGGMELAMARQALEEMNEDTFEEDMIGEQPLFGSVSSKGLPTHSPSRARSASGNSMVGSLGGLPYVKDVDVPVATPEGGDGHVTVGSSLSRSGGIFEGASRRFHCHGRSGSNNSVDTMTSFSQEPPSPSVASIRTMTPTPRTGNPSNTSPTSAVFGKDKTLAHSSSLSSLAASARALRHPVQAWTHSSSKLGPGGGSSAAVNGHGHNRNRSSSDEHPKSKLAAFLGGGSSKQDEGSPTVPAKG